MNLSERIDLNGAVGSEPAITQGVLKSTLRQREAGFSRCTAMAASRKVKCSMIVVPFLMLLMSWRCTTADQDSNSDYAYGEEDASMDKEEAEAVYEVLEGINEEVAWRELHPGDNPCVDGPHGLNCDADEGGVLHVVELNIGWVAETGNNPRCARNATFSPSLWKLKYLNKLMMYNCFSAREVALPEAGWGELAGTLRHLVIMRNAALVGPIPGGLGSLGMLERLVVAGNGRLGGPIPAELGGLARLEELVLRDNNLTGELLGLGSFPGLRIFDASGNGLSGGLGPLFGPGPGSGSTIVHLRMQKLDLSGNSLTGPVPPELGPALPAVELLDLSRNGLRGPLPTSLVSLSRLRFLHMGSNPLYAPLPSSWPLNLTALVLSRASLYGPIPPAIADLRGLRYLDLHANDLRGRIPYRLGQLPRLYRLDLAGNRLSGLLPFSPELLSKMGRNLRVGGNAGLCYNYPPPPKVSAIVGLGACSDAPFSSSSSPLLKADNYSSLSSSNASFVINSACSSLSLFLTSRAQLASLLLAVCFCSFFL